MWPELKIVYWFNALKFSNFKFLFKQITSLILQYVCVISASFIKLFDTLTSRNIQVFDLIYN
jgi:hypothetical protein